MDSWKASHSVVELLYKRIDTAFPELTELKAGRIAVLMHEKAREKHGVVEYGTIKRAPTNLRLLTDKKFEYDFVVSLAADRWENNLDDTQRIAVLDHLLCSLVVKDEDKSGQIVYEIRPPEVQMYLREIDLHGIWWPDSQAVEKMFGKWLGPVSSTAPITRGPGIPPPNFSTTAPTTSAVPTGTRLPPKKGAKATKPRDQDGDMDGDDLDLPFVDPPSMSN